MERNSTQKAVIDRDRLESSSLEVFKNEDAVLRDVGMVWDVGISEVLSNLNDSMIQFPSRPWLIQAPPHPSRVAQSTAC